MSEPKIEKAVVDLRGVRTQAQERRERLRREAQDWEKYIAKNTERTLTSTEKAWNDVFGGVFRVTGIMLLLVSSWTYLPAVASSLSYFSDTEGSASLMASGMLDLVVSSSSMQSELSCGETSDTTIHVESVGNPAFVNASTAQMTGSTALCEAIELEVIHLGETIYSGTLQDFSAENVEDGDMRFFASLAEDAGPFADDAQCTASIEYTSVQQRHSENGTGYRDTEVVELMFTVDTGSCESCNEPCNTCGDVYIDITNENNSTNINIFDIVTNTGGNEANGEEGADGGVIETGDATGEVEVTEGDNVNETTITIGCECEGECDCESADVTPLEPTDSMNPTSNGAGEGVETPPEPTDTEDPASNGAGEEEELDIENEEDTITTPDEIDDYIQQRLDEALARRDNRTH